MMMQRNVSRLIPDALLGARAVHELITVVVDADGVVVAAAAVVDDGGSGGGGGGLSQDVEVVVLVLVLVLVVMPDRQAAVVLSDQVLQVRNVGDGHAQGLHLRQSFVAGLVRHVLAQAQEGRVHRLHAPPLTRVPLGHQVHGLERVGHVLVHRFLAFSTCAFAATRPASASVLPRGLAG